MKKLRIGQVAPLNIPIPPKKYGGTERIIDALCCGLTSRGHEIFIFAAKNVQTKGNLIPVTPKFLWSNDVKDAGPYYAYEMSVVAQESRKLKLDIIHDHLGPWGLTLYGNVNNIPIVHTLHVPTTPDRAWAYKRVNANLVSISNNQRRAAPHLNYIATIYNGTDTKLYKFNPQPKNYFLFIGELVERKGVLDAIIIAKKLKLNLLIAGRLPLSTPSQIKDFEFFQKRVKPELNRGKIRYVGEIGGRNLAKFYGEAKATLFPIHWEEPFGLVMIESMSCGTPVIAFRQGSVPEVIKDQETGFIVKKLSQMGQAIKNIGAIDRSACRRHVETYFSLDTMVDNYEQLFLNLLKNKV